jgi:hypothetical protein
MAYSEKKALQLSANQKELSIFVTGDGSLTHLLNNIFSKKKDF